MALSPEEIRHVSIKRRVRGYDRRETEQLLEEIAQSFEAVWHQRSNLYEDVQRLRAEVQTADLGRELQDAEVADLYERLKHKDAAIANLGEEAKREATDRQALLAESERAQGELAHLREEIEDERSKRVEQEQRWQAELAQLREEAERLRAERGRLLEDSRQSGEEVVTLRESVDRLHADRNQLADESERLAAELGELHNEVTRLEAERGRLLQQSARSRAESAELRSADRNRQAELADLRRDLQRLETERAALRDHLEETEAELGMHPRAARRLRELEEETRARYRNMRRPTPEPQENAGEAEPLSAPHDHEEGNETEAADRDSQLLSHLNPKATARGTEESASEPVNGGAADP